MFLCGINPLMFRYLAFPPLFARFALDLKKKGLYCHLNAYISVVTYRIYIYKKTKA